MGDLIARGMAANAKRVTDGIYVYNEDKGLIRYRAAKAKVDAGEAVIYNIPFIGDSITEGTNDTTGAATIVTTGYVGRIRTAMNAKYTDLGLGFFPVHYPYGGGTTYWTFSGTWGTGGYSYGVCGSLKLAAANNTTSQAVFNFHGTGVGVVHVKGSGCGNMDYSIDAGAVTGTLNTYNATNILAFASEITGLSDGDHTITFTHPADGKAFYLIGCYPITAGTHGFRVNNCAKFGVTTASAVGGASHAKEIAEIDVWNPPLTVIAFTANDYHSQVALATYEANLTTLVQRADNFGSVMLVSTGLYNDPKPIPQSDYIEVMRKVAIANNCCYVDVASMWGSDADYAQNTLLLINDGVHPTASGHQSIANAILKVLDI